MRLPVLRASRVHLIALSACGQRIDRQVEGFEARIVQHECDHLDGVLLPDRVAST
jgi:peptide deformylase